MTIHLSESRERFVRSLVENGCYASEEEVIEAALKLLEQQDRNLSRKAKRVETLLIEGLVSGPSTPMTPEDWDDIDAKGNVSLPPVKVTTVDQ